VKKEEAARLLRDEEKKIKYNLAEGGSTPALYDDI
jgi:hypothetical protein